MASTEDYSACTQLYFSSLTELERWEQAVSDSAQTQEWMVDITVGCGIPVQVRSTDWLRRKDGVQVNGED